MPQSTSREDQTARARHGAPGREGAARRTGGRTGRRLTAEQVALVERHLDLLTRVVRHALRRYPAHVDRDEVWQAGAIGLVAAATKLDASDEEGFQRQAANAIRWAIIDAARAGDWAPRSVRRFDRSVEQATAQAAHELGRAPTEAELATRLGLTTAEVRRGRERSQRAAIATLDATTAMDGATMTSLGERIEDPAAVDAFGGVESAELHRYLRAAVRVLSPRIGDVIRWYFLDGRSSSEIADALGVTEARVSQLRHEGLRLLRAGIEAQYEGLPAVGPRTRVVERRRAAYAWAVHDEAAADLEASAGAGWSGTGPDGSLTDVA